MSYQEISKTISFLQCLGKTEVTDKSNKTIQEEYHNKIWDYPLAGA
jgi:hypothetical protein